MTDAARDELGRIADAAAARFGGESPSPKASNSVAGRNPEGDASLPADDLAIGSYVFSKAVRGCDGNAAKHGMVVDYGFDGCPVGERRYVVVLAEDGPWRVDVRRWGSTGKGERQVRTGALRRLYLDDIDATLTRPPDVMHMHTGASLAALTVGVGVGGKLAFAWSAEQDELMLYAATLLDEAKALLGVGR